ncbi:FaeA/PapI family transcriptional regulator [Patescibacteria group bacterium]|nr:FaeA/PapI family transcriptional regulator [Patescibacteria group bacterium]
MSQVIYFFLGVIVGAGALYYIKSRVGQGEEAGPKGPGLIEKQAEEKQANKEKILEFFTSHNQAANNEIEDFLGVSDATATRYLDELEKEGRIKQVGKTGRSVFYKKT